MKHADPFAVQVSLAQYRIDGEWGRFPWWASCQHCGWADAFPTKETAQVAAEKHLAGER